ncbi:hypothetical protein HND92_00855 [Diaphorobacter sp. JS3050]|uniref:hypothetical protein n=1 Tax=Diaphorobacter sp. JS3050 TaxID=2735554 RepID=UPI001555DFDE|nr:hypothetical protein [Diaphorobacter sp. JS3050]QJY31665.1 hypothetical protein HND92_00855 [Diaphorobacter sp. JS3050]
MTTKFRLAGYSVLVAATLLTACGGGGSDDASTATPTPAPPPAATSAEGFWMGKSAAGYDVAVAVLENGDTWGVYTSGSTLYGALQGKTTSSNGALTGSGREFNLLSNSVSQGSYSGTYTAKNRLDLRLSDGNSFSATYSTFYDQPTSLSALAGTYRGYGVGTGAPVQWLAVTISASGAVSYPTTLGCSASGSVTPRASGKNIFDLRITFSGASCTLGNGATVSGVGYYESGKLIAMGLLPSQTAGFIFSGSK